MRLSMDQVLLRLVVIGARNCSRLLPPAAGAREPLLQDLPSLVLFPAVRLGLSRKQSGRVTTGISFTTVPRGRSKIRLVYTEISHPSLVMVGAGRQLDPLLRVANTFCLRLLLGRPFDFGNPLELPATTIHAWSSQRMVMTSSPSRSA